MKAFLQAARPLAHINLALPLAFGQALAFAHTRTFSLEACFYAHAFGLLDHLFIVFANDVADQEADARNPNPTIVSGGSRVLVEGKIAPDTLRRASVLALGALFGLCVFRAVDSGQWGFLAAFAAAAFLLWAYSFRPIRLSYRGSGEVLQGLGVGVVLLLLGYYAQAGTLEGLLPPVVVGSFLFGVASNITTAIPDREADAAVGKSTWPVRFGVGHARASAAVISVSAVLIITLAFEAIPWGARFPVAGVSVLILAGSAVLRRSRPTGVGFVILQHLAIQLFLVGLIIVLVTATPPP